MKLVKIEIEQMGSAGCNNGNYPNYKATFDNGETYEGAACACQSGCSGTDRLPSIGSEFESIKQFSEYASRQGEFEND